MYVPGHAIRKHHEETYGPLDKFGYKDFIPMFKAEKFDADAWAELFKKAGARFAGPVAEHADGFAMWDSDLTDWNAAKMGPKRDVVGWKIYGEGPQEIVEGHLSERKNKDATAEDIRFTTRGNILYAIILDWPANRTCRIKALGLTRNLLGKVSSIELLGHPGTIAWSRDAEALTVNLPDRKPCEHAFVLKIR